MITTRHRTRTALVAVLAAGGIAPTAVLARNSQNQGSGDAPIGIPVRIVRSAPARGFAWGDAGIGAVSGIGLSLLGLGGTLATRRHTQRAKRRLAVG